MLNRFIFLTIELYVKILSDGLEKGQEQGDLFIIYWHFVPI